MLDPVILLINAEILFCAGGICILELYRIKALKQPKQAIHKAMRILGIALLAISAICIVIAGCAVFAEEVPLSLPTQETT